VLCRFCSQWNPEGALRCCFCNNLSGATQDQTRGGRVTVVSARLPAVQRDGRSLAEVTEELKAEPEGYRRDMLRADLIWKIVVGIAVGLFALWQLAGLLGRCR
jgi:hypothetical protein